MADAPFGYMIYWVLIQNFLMFCLHSVTFVILSKFLVKLKTLKYSEISPQFLVYLISIILMAILGLINSIYVLCVWWNGTNSPLVIYTTTAAVISFLPISSLSVSFLIIHRIFVINRNFTTQAIHRWIFYVSLCCMATLTVITIAYYSYTWTLIEQPAANTCWTVNCVTRFNGSIFTVWAKLFTGFANALLGSWFLYELKKSQKESRNLGNQSSNKNNRKRANNLTTLTVILEVVLNFIPAVIDLILRSTINFALTQYIGVYAMFFASADGAFIAVFYAKSFGKLKSVINSNNFTNANVSSSKGIRIVG